MERGRRRAHPARRLFGQAPQTGVPFYGAAPLHPGGGVQRVRGAAGKALRLFARHPRPRGDPCRHRRRRRGDGSGMLRAGGIVHLLFGAVLFFLRHRRQQRQPRAVQAALPQAVFHRPQRLRLSRLPPLPCGPLYGGRRRKAAARGRVFFEDRRPHALGRLCGGGGALLPRHFGRKRGRAQPFGSAQGL